MRTHNVFITGGTGYVGRRLIPALARRGHTVRALVRTGSESKLPQPCGIVTGNALEKKSFANQIAPSDTFVQLVGVPHPSPAKAEMFRRIDLVSVRTSVSAAAAAKVDHFVYVSVAHPAPVMKAYQAVREEGERLIQAAGLRATILRPWYILGPGHWWPLLLLPAYWACEFFPATRVGAQRLGLVKLQQMIDALVGAVESPPSGVHVVGVPQIRNQRESKKPD